LYHLQAAHPSFPNVLCRTLASILAGTISSTNTSEKNDPSYYIYVACWVTWIVETWKNVPDLKLEILSILMKGLGFDPSPLSLKPAASDLLKRLSTGLEEVEAVNILLSKESSKWSKTWDLCDLDMMKNRLEQLQFYLHSSGETNSTHPEKIMAEPAQDVAIPGWCILVENRGWEPCPIGIYNEN